MLIKMKTIKLSIFLVLLTLLSCQKKEEAAAGTYHSGNLKILVDDSFFSVTEALADGYMINYPDTKLSVIKTKEDFALIDLLKNKAGAIVMSRELTTKEVGEFERLIDMKPQPAKFAADAVLFVVPVNSARNQISMEEIENELYSENKNLIFDGTNSSNLNFIASKFGKKPSELKFSIIKGNKNIIEQLNKYPDKIGIIALNTFSRDYDEESQNLRENVKILSVLKEGKIYTSDPESIRKMAYPFTRILYFLTNEGNFSIANGFIRFSCTHLGQKIVQKEGLQPYNMYRREVEMR